MKRIIWEVGETKTATKTLAFEKDGRMLQQLKQSNRVAGLEVLHFSAA